MTLLRWVLFRRRSAGHDLHRQIKTHSENQDQIYNENACRDTQHGTLGKDDSSSLFVFLFSRVPLSRHKVTRMDATYWSNLLPAPTNCIPLARYLTKSTHTTQQATQQATPRSAATIHNAVRITTNDERRTTNDERQRNDERLQAHCHSTMTATVGAMSVMGVEGYLRSNASAL